MTQQPLATLKPRYRPNVTLQLFECTLADKEIIRSLFLNCFTEIVSRTVFPPEEPTVLEWWDNALTDELQDPDSRFLKVVALSPSGPQTDNDAGSSEGEAIAFAKWGIPNDEKAMEEDPPREWPAIGGEREKLAKKVGDIFFGGLASGHVRTVKGELGNGLMGHWYLEMLGTLPNWRGLGAAGLMVRWGLEQADRSDRITYLESSPGAVALYYKFGFESRGRVNVKVEDIEYYNELMIRRPTGT